MGTIINTNDQSVGFVGGDGESILNRLFGRLVLKYVDLDTGMNLCR